MIRREGERMVVSGAVTLGNVATLLEDGRRHLADGVLAIDLAEVNQMDSALLALVLAWLREANARGQALVVRNPPASLRTIARLYGVESLLPLAA